MNIFEAIRTRRSIGKVKQEEVSVAAIERILDAGTWAPNHRRTEPWRFFVMRGEGRNKYAQASTAIAHAGNQDADADKLAELATKAQDRSRRAPLIIGVAVEPSDKNGVIEIEEYGAVFAAIQNMLLEIHGQGLAAVWRTGGEIFDPLMNEHFGLSEKGKMLGFLYIGQPESSDLPEGKRESYQTKTVWIDEA